METTENAIMASRIEAAEDREAELRMRLLASQHECAMLRAEIARLRAGDRPTEVLARPV